MAAHSNCIDTRLASEMKESNTCEVSFPDIAPETWESMMKEVLGQAAGGAAHDSRRCDGNSPIV
jgi:hypothetical protein